MASLEIINYLVAHKMAARFSIMDSLSFYLQESSAMVTLPSRAGARHGAGFCMHGQLQIGQIWQSNQANFKHEVNKK